MKILRIILPIAVIAGAALLVLYSPDIAPEKYADLATFFRVERSRQGFSGYSVAAVSKGSILYLDGYGKDGGGNAIDSGTRLVAPAVEKSLVALALLSLARDGVVGLDDPVRKYLPWFGFADGSGGEVTLRHLAAHAAGVSDTAFNDLHPEAPDLLSAAKAMTSVRPRFAPGKRLAYIDTGYQVLALAMESASGKDIGSLVDRRVVKVLGLKSTTISPLEAPPRGNVSFFSSAVPRDAKFPPYGPPSGTTSTSAADMGAYLSYLLAPERSKRAVLPARTIRSVFEPLVEGVPYGAGWFLRDEEGRSFAYHDGAVGGFSSRVLVEGAEGTGIAVLAAQGSLLQSMISLPALTDGAMRIIRDGSTGRPFPLGRLYILLLVVAAVHLVGLGSQTGGALAWARDIKCRTEAKGTRIPLRFAILRSWLGIALRAAIAVLAPLALGLAFDRSIGWRLLFDLEPGAAAWCLSACFFGVVRNVARLSWLGRAGIPRAMR